MPRTTSGPGACTVVKCSTNHRTGQSGVLPWALLLPSSSFTQWTRNPGGHGEVSTWSPCASILFLGNSLRPEDSLANSPKLVSRDWNSLCPISILIANHAASVQPLLLKVGQGTALSGMGQRLDRHRSRCGNLCILDARCNAGYSWGCERKVDIHGHLCFYPTLQTLEEVWLYKQIDR